MAHKNIKDMSPFEIKTTRQILADVLNELDGIGFNEEITLKEMDEYYENLDQEYESIKADLEHVKVNPSMISWELL